MQPPRPRRPPALPLRRSFCDHLTFREPGAVQSPPHCPLTHTFTPDRQATLSQGLCGSRTQGDGPSPARRGMRTPSRCVEPSGLISAADLDVWSAWSYFTVRLIDGPTSNEAACAQPQDSVPGGGVRGRGGQYSPVSCRRSWVPRAAESALPVPFHRKGKGGSGYYRLMSVMEMVPLGRHEVMSVVVRVSVLMKETPASWPPGKGTLCGNRVLADEMK